MKKQILVIALGIFTFVSIFAQNTKTDSIRKETNRIRKENDRIKKETDKIRDKAFRLYRRSNLIGAKTELKKIIEIRPNDAKTLFDLGTISYELGQIEEAADYFKKLPSDRQAMFNLGAISSQLGKREEAIEYFQKCMWLGDKEAAKILRENYNNFDFMFADEVDELPKFLHQGKLYELNTEENMFKFSSIIRNNFENSPLLDKLNYSGIVYLRLVIDKNGKMICIITRGIQSDVHDEIKSIVENAFMLIMPAQYQSMDVGISAFILPIRLIKPE
ncbi:MAG: tetratricopeptide repeat protein [Bacteroidales bacterium]|nr:tetratricopeptide repeat protein [Bacteroidales bacterium]